MPKQGHRDTEIKIEGRQHENHRQAKHRPGTETAF